MGRASYRLRVKEQAAGAVDPDFDFAFPFRPLAPRSDPDAFGLIRRWHGMEVSQTLQRAAFDWKQILANSL